MTWISQPAGVQMLVSGEWIVVPGEKTALIAALRGSVSPDRETNEY
jgi:hypothetical protein